MRVIALGAQVALQAGEHRLFLPLGEGGDQRIMRIFQRIVKQRLQRFAGRGEHGLKLRGRELQIQLRGVAARVVEGEKPLKQRA